MTAVGLGCIGFSLAYGAPTEKSEAVRMIRNSADRGLCRLEVDRIDLYNQHRIDSETAEINTLLKSDRKALCMDKAPKIMVR